MALFERRQNVGDGAFALLCNRRDVETASKLINDDFQRLGLKIHCGDKGNKESSNVRSLQKHFLMTSCSGCQMAGQKDRKYVRDKEPKKELCCSLDTLSTNTSRKEENNKGSKHRRQIDWQHREMIRNNILVSKGR